MRDRIIFWVVFPLGLLALPSFTFTQAAVQERPSLTLDILDRSLALGRDFILHNQKSEGNFFYEYDFVARRDLEGDNPVRQAGALWSLALIHADHPTAETLEALKRGFAFFDKHSKVTGNGRKYIAYLADTEGRTGTIALVALALVDFLRAETNLENPQKYREALKGYLQMLLSLRMPNGQFHRGYRLEDGEPLGPPSPYFDGETLLAFVKAAKYLGFRDLQKVILESAETAYQKNVVEPLGEDLHHKTAKGFYQWGSMAYYELYTSGWPGVEGYAKRVIDLAYWLISVRKPLERKRNTGYAFEGLVSAWELARLTRNREALRKIGEVIDQGLLKLSSWQVGTALENNFLRSHPTDDPRAVGGAMNGESDPRLRIDVTQHQMHAVILARRHIYKE